MESIRCFVAVELAPAVKAALGRLENELRRAVTCPAKWVAPEGIHLTLCFLGEISRDLIPPFKEAIASVCTEHAPFQLGLEGLGVFPSIQRAQVVWVGVGGETGRLALLQKALEARLAPLGYQPENRRFSPHLTLARLREGATPADCQGLAAALSRPNPLPECRIAVDRVSLVQSRLTPAGALYTSLAAARLGAPPPG